MLPIPWPADIDSAPAMMRTARRLGLALVIAAGIAAGPASGQAPAVPGPADGHPPARAGEIAAGRRVYLEGRLPSGHALVATASDGTRLTGEQAACVTCHRRSGLGKVAGGRVALPVTGDILFQPVWRGRPEMDMARTTGPNARPAYDDRSLARALATGVGANGLALEGGMPRYGLSPADLQSLAAYLRTLSSKPSAGVDGTAIRFATIIAGDVPAGRRKAFLDVVETFTREKNGGTRYEARRRARPPMDMAFEYVRYRDWTIDVWTVGGPAASWPAQLEALYQTQPVFAVLSGLAEGPWWPIHEFCETTGVPCLFPATDEPALDRAGFYTAYFWRGATLEADVVTSYLRAQPDDLRAPLVQVFREGRPGAVAAEALAARALLGGARPVSIALAPGEPAHPALWRRLGSAHPGATFAIWLETADVSDLGSLADAGPGPSRLFLSSSLAPAAADSLPAGLREVARIVHPFERPDRFDLRVQRTRTWLRARKIASPANERMQAEAFFALSIVNEALMHNYNFFVREYLLEQIETMGPTMVVSAYFPAVDLGAGQRFGSRGAYILKPGEQHGSAPVVVSDWIVP